MKQSALLFSFLLYLFAFTSCKESAEIKPPSTGVFSEIVLVTEDYIWDNPLGDTVKSFFTQNLAGMPQPEPLYKLVRVADKSFGVTIRKHRNVLVMEIDSTLTEPTMESFRDVWAKPQRVVKFVAPTYQSLHELFRQRKYEAMSSFENSEMETINRVAAGVKNYKVAEAVKAKFNIDLTVPSSYYIAADKPNFLWIRQETNLTSQGILIFSTPYVDQSNLAASNVLRLRDQYTLQYVPGPSDSSYMQVEFENDVPLSRNVTLNNDFAVETKGLWRVEGDFMGGPFVNYAFVDKLNNQLIVLDGYVYAPNSPKRTLIKELQAYLLSAKLVEKAQAAK